MSAGRFGIVNDPEDVDVAVLMHDGEPIGTIERRQNAVPGFDGRVRFAVAGLTVVSRHGPGVVHVERDSTVEATTCDRFGAEDYAAWKDRLGISGDAP